jgi:hypothetical protein
MSKLLFGISALALLAAAPAGAAPYGDGAPDARTSPGIHTVAHKSHRHHARRHHTYRHHRGYAHRDYYPGSSGGYGGGYAAMPGDPLGRNPAVEYYRRQGRCVTDEGYGRYSFCDDF